MKKVIYAQFSNPIAGGVSTGNYVVNVYIEPTGAQRQANVYVQLTSGYLHDWYANNPGAPVYLYIDGGLVWSSDLCYWGANGSGLNGVHDSQLMHAGTFTVNSSSSQLRIVVDCSKKPLIMPPDGAPGGSLLGICDASTNSWPGVVFRNPARIEAINRAPYNGNGQISSSWFRSYLGWNKTSGDNPDRVDCYLYDDSGKEDAANLKGSFGNVPSGGATIPDVTETSPNRLQDGTVYRGKMMAIHNGGVEHVAYVRFRTRHAAPVLTLPSSGRFLEKITVNWYVTNGKKCQKVYYKIATSASGLNSASWVNPVSGADNTSGTITINGLAPNTTYHVRFKVLSTGAYDAIESSEITTTVATYDIARLTSTANFTFGNNYPYTKTNPSGNTNRLKIVVGGTTIREDTISANSGTITFTQANLDAMYKKYTNTNTVAVTFTLITVGTKEYTASYNGTITLTGNAKTAHVGVSDKPRRANVWIGVNGTARRCVMWVGDSSGKARRCI